MSWQAAKQDMVWEYEQKAWELYCKETAGDMNVVDFWSELSSEVQDIYFKKVWPAYLSGN